MKNIYSDFKLDFLAHPATGDLVKVIDENAISGSIRNLLLTNHGEVLFSPWVGGNLTAYMFEPVSPIIEHAIKRTITKTIEEYEPRVRILSLAVTYNESQNSYNVSLKYKAIGLDRPVMINFVLQRVR